MVDVRVKTLDTGGDDLQDLVGAEAGQLEPGEFLGEFGRTINILEVDESVADVALVAEIDGQVEEVVHAIIPMVVEPCQKII